MVVSRKADLYDGEQLSPLRLYPGDVLLAWPCELRPDWLAVRIDQRALRLKALNCARLSDLLVSYARRTADLDSRIEELGRDVAAHRDAAAQLYAAEVAIRFDATVQYCYRDAIPVVTPPPAPPPTAPAPVPMVQYVERYEDRIPPSRARSLAERWADERRGLEKAADRLQQQRRDRLQERHDLDARRADTEWRFRRSAGDPTLSPPEPCVAVSPRTPLYDRTRLTDELDLDTVVLASPNRQHDQWLRVLWNGQTLDGPGEKFVNRLAVECQLGDRAAWLQQAIRDLTDEADALASRRQLLEAVGLAVDYTSRLDYTTLRAYPFAVGYPGQRYYAPPLRPALATEVVNRSRARSFLKACDKGLDTLADDARDTDSRLRSWRRELAAIGPRLDDLRHRLELVP